MSDHLRNLLGEPMPGHPDYRYKAQKHIPRCSNCGMVVSREGGPCERVTPCGTVSERAMCPSCAVEHDAVRVNGVLIVGCPKHPKDPPFTMVMEFTDTQVDAEALRGATVELHPNPPPVCRWCRETEAEHEPASEPNRPRARCPCLGWRENFVPDTRHVVTAAQRPSPPPLKSAPSEGLTTADIDLIARLRQALEPSAPSEPRETRLAALGEGFLMVQSMEISDEHRLTVVREIWKLHTESGRINMIDTLYEYERKVKERLR